MSHGSPFVIELSEEDRWELERRSRCYSLAHSTREGHLRRGSPPRGRTDINAGNSVDRQWAEPMATSGHIHDRLRAGSHGRRQPTFPRAIARP
jgi:hypothetical protein